MVEGRAPVTIEKEGRGREKERESSLLAVTRGGKRVVKCDGREKGEKSAPRVRLPSRTQNLAIVILRMR